MEQQIGYYWGLLLDKINGSGLPVWLAALILVLAAIGVLVILRNVVFGGGRGDRGGGSSSVVIPPGRPPRQTPSSPLTDFRMPKSVYDFSMPSPVIKTDGLRKPLNVDVDLARQLFVPRMQERQTKLEAMMQPKVPSSRQAPDWKLAQKLFVPNFRRSNGTVRKED